MAGQINMNDRVNVNVTDLINERPLSGLQLRIIILCGLVMYLDGYDIGTVSTTAPLLAEAVRVKVSTFGPVFSAGFFGVMLGSLLLGSIADRIGRKWMIITSTFVFGFCTLITPLAASREMLIVLRFLTGIGIGGALPNALAMTSEFAPQRSRSFLMTAMFAGVPIGGATAPLLGAYFLKHNWHWTFYFGGVLPLLLCVILIATLPESIRFLVTKGEAAERVAQLVTRMFGQFMPTGLRQGTTVNFLLSEDPHKVKVPVAQLMKEGRALVTICIWVANFMNLLVALLVVSWFPTVLRQNGLPLATGLRIASLFSVGGVVGTPILGRLMDRWNPRMVLTFSYSAAVILIGSFGFAGSSLLRLAIFTFLAGFCIFGSQAGLMAVSATLYPTSLRATGLGWVLGVGRIGSIVGPMLGGMMLARHWQLTHLFMAAALPVLVAVLCVVWMNQLLLRRRSDGGMVPQTLTAYAADVQHFNSKGTST